MTCSADIRGKPRDTNPTTKTAKQTHGGFFEGNFYIGD